MKWGQQGLRILLGLTGLYQHDCGFGAVEGVRGVAGASGWTLTESSSDVNGCMGGVKGAGDNVPGRSADAEDR